jgi:hypothetical protein
LAQKSGAKDQKSLEKYIQSLGEEGLKQAYKEFTEYMQSQTQKAEHGAKLQYVKKLKRICQDDEELVYFKKGGSIDCGCVKKQTGGELPEKKTETLRKNKKKIKVSCGGSKFLK